MKSRGVKRLSADLQKCGLAEMKRSDGASRFVKLQRPPPEMRIFAPGCRLRSSSKILRPRHPAVSAHISPAAPAPTMMASKRSTEFAHHCKATTRRRATFHLQTRPARLYASIRL